MAYYLLDRLVNLRDEGIGNQRITKSEIKVFPLEPKDLRQNCVCVSVGVITDFNFIGGGTFATFLRSRVKKAN